MVSKSHIDAICKSVIFVVCVLVEKGTIYLPLKNCTQLFHKLTERHPLGGTDSLHVGGGGTYYG